MSINIQLGGKVVHLILTIQNLLSTYARTHYGPELCYVCITQRTKIAHM